MTSPEQIEKNIQPFLQKKVIFALENKILKRGRLILFCVKDFFCTFTLICEEKNNKKIIYEIPYPFKFDSINEKLIFDYTINSFCQNKQDLSDIFKKINFGKPSKILNKKITISSL